MAEKFPGFPAAGMTFLKQLKKNNDREWFTPRKQTFLESVQEPMYSLVEAINQEMASFAPEHLTEPKKAVYRIYRDTRFSKDKTPYKTHIAANFFRRGSEKHAAAGYYCSVSPEQIEIAAGVYMPGPAELLAIRKHLSANLAEFERLLAAKGLEKLVGPLQGDSLTRPPKGFSAEDPAIDWIRRKQWYFYDTRLDPALAVTPKLAGEIVRRFATMAPVVDYFNRALAGKRRKPEILL
jgi:uncharacterized protein (TIGR02453 family)